MDSGLLGIGGGMILSPLLLVLGVHPLVSAATSSVLVLFTSSSAALSFGFDGTLNWQFALLFALTSFCVSLVGVLVVVGAVRRSGKVCLSLPVSRAGAPPPSLPPPPPLSFPSFPSSDLTLALIQQVWASGWS